jgi:hypothetical protein
MRIRIKTTMPMPETPPEVELETGRLRDLFAKAFGNTHFAKEIIDPKTGDIVWDGIVDMTLNGMPYHSLEQGLDTELCDGDTVVLSLIMLGGG